MHYLVSTLVATSCPPHLGAAALLTGPLLASLPAFRLHWISGLLAGARGAGREACWSCRMAATDISACSQAALCPAGHRVLPNRGAACSAGSGVGSAGWRATRQPLQLAVPLPCPQHAVSQLHMPQRGSCVHDCLRRHPALPRCHRRCGSASTSRSAASSCSCAP